MSRSRLTRFVPVTLILAVLALLAAGAVACGSPQTTGEQTQTAAAGSTTPNPVGTATLTATGSVVPGTISVTAMKELPADLVSPVFSPDGSEILAGAPGGLDVGSADGTNLHLIDGTSAATSFAWSPDGKKIAVTMVQGGLKSSQQSSELVLMNADGSSPVDIGKSDFPAYVQFLPDGRLAFVRDTQLHLFNPSTGTDTVEARASAITNNAAVETVSTPFLVSDDGSYVATMSGTSLSVQNLASGESKQLTNKVDDRHWSGYGWSPTGFLAYSDEDPTTRFPALHLYDPTTGGDRVLVQGNEWGVFSGVSWSTANWLIFVFYPSGTGAEELAQYQAIDVTTGVSKVLFTNGMGLRISAQGRKLFFTRSASPTTPFSQWVATLAVQ